MSTSQAAELWGATCQHLQQILHPDVYSRWIAVIQPLDLTEDTITLSVDNDFYQSWLEENYLPLILSALSAASNRDWKISFSVSTRLAVPAAPLLKKKAPRERSARSDTPQPTLNYIAKLDRKQFDIIEGKERDPLHSVATASWRVSVCQLNWR